MAEIILTAVINKAVELAGNPLLQEWSRLSSLEENINWLQREMRHIRSYIYNAKAMVAEGETREGDTRVMQVKNLIKDVEELAGDAEDLLDEFILKMEPRRSKGAFSALKERIASIFSYPFVAHKFSKEIEKIKVRVGDINRLRTTYGIRDTTDNNNQHNFGSMDQGRLFLQVDNTEVIGLDDDFNLLKSKLLDQDLQYGVISIVGMPGLGKTTLAKKLYRHVRDRFECSALVYVSKQPIQGEILLDIAKQVGLSEEERKDDLKGNLRSLLNRKKYVILLDDIWNTQFWDEMKLILPERYSKFGSRVIITSRNRDVGGYIGETKSLHVLQPLDSEKSLELFTKSVFSSDSSDWEDAPPYLKNIGKEIAGRCGGIPLTIVLIAGMLRKREKSVHEWRGLLESMSQEIQEGCGKSLALSYNDLPISLRPCFLYFGLFPEDHEILAFELTNMWIAEKFIVASNNTRKEVEDIAQDCLKELVSRNLIQVSRIRFNGSIASCRIHDLLHELCVTLAKESNFFLTKDRSTSGDLTKQRRLALYSDEVVSSHPNPKKLRALLSFSGSYTSLINFKLLRVLFVNYLGSDGVPIPKGIGSLSSLVYLKLQGSHWGVMPHSIVKLKHLMTLDIRGTHLRITYGVMQMKQLRHLCLTRSSRSPFIETREYASSINPAMLPNLQTLICTQGEYMKASWFHQWTNLRKLTLYANHKFMMEVFSTPVPMMLKLEFLKLKAHYTDRQDLQQINLSSYQNLLKFSLTNFHDLVNFEELPPNLIKLRARLHPNEIRMIKTLPNLKILKLERIVAENQIDLVRIFAEYQIDLSGVNSFPQLEELHITGDSAEYWSKRIIMDEVGAPKLNNLFGYNRSLLKLPERRPTVN